MSAFVGSFKGIDEYELVDQDKSLFIANKLDESALVKLNHAGNLADAMITTDDNNKVRMSKFSCSSSGWCCRCADYRDCFQLVLACVCPCILFGHMKSLVGREETTDICCSDYRLGRQGCNTCLNMACVTACGWPCPCGTQYALLNQRRMLRSAYNEEVSLTHQEYLCECASICCLWPCVLQQHFNYLNTKSVNNMLLFDWETQDDVVADKSKVPPKSTTYRVVVLGSEGCGKTTFSRKLLQASNTHTSGNTNSLQVGYRPLNVTPTSVEYLEVWDCPQNNMSASERSMIISNSDSVALLYDMSNEHSLNALIELFDEIGGETLKDEKNIVIIGTKLDIVWKTKAMCDDLDSTMGEVKEKIHGDLLLIAAQSKHVREWCDAHQLHHIEVSSQANFNMIPGLKMVLHR
jgi:hypothetical protein